MPDDASKRQTPTVPDGLVPQIIEVVNDNKTGHKIKVHS
jgi:hypothetical protein